MFDKFKAKLIYEYLANNRYRKRAMKFKRSRFK